MQPGARVPKARLIDVDLQPIDVESLAADGPFLLSFYLYDWTGT
jgi:hypothetical protein